MLNRVRERIHPQELIQARAAAEAKSLPKQPAKRPAGWGRVALHHLLAEAPVERPFHLGRYTVDALVPAGQLAVVPLPDPAETVMAEIHALVPGTTAKAGA